MLACCFALRSSWGRNSVWCGAVLFGSIWGVFYLSGRSCSVQAVFLGIPSARGSCGTGKSVCMGLCAGCISVDVRVGHCQCWTWDASAVQVVFSFGFVVGFRATNWSGGRAALWRCFFSGRVLRVNRDDVLQWFLDCCGLFLVVPVEDSNLVDSASSHTLVSKTKPCKSKYKSFTLKLRMAHYISYSLFDSPSLLG